MRESRSRAEQSQHIRDVTYGELGKAYKIFIYWKNDMLSRGL